VRDAEAGVAVTATTRDRRGFLGSHVGDVSKMSLKTIIFDFGNVVAFFDHSRALRQLLGYTELSFEELWRILYGSRLEDLYERGRITTREFVRDARREARLTCSEATFLAAYVDIFWGNDEVHAIIPRLKPRYRLLLASNTNAAHFERFTRQFAEILGQFDRLCPSHHCGFRKPEAEYFADCQEHAAAKPSECLFIDDLAENVEAAQRHGWQGICYQQPGTLAEKLQSAGVQFD
jgi:FMN phosphatase YigB (HAD superfamily)